LTLNFISSVENDLDQQNPSEDGPDVYEDDEARVFHNKGELVVKYTIAYIIILN
jgi:hypothetical protein